MFGKALTALAVVAGVLAVPLAAGAAAPSSRAIAFVSTRSGSNQIYVVNTDGSGLRRLTYNNDFKREPAWSPDRTRIAFVQADASGNWNIFVMNADGTDARQVTSDPARENGPRWTADGRIVYQHDNRIWIVNADGSGAAELPTGPGDAVTPDASPKGDTVAFSNGRAIYTMQLSGRRLRQVTSPTAGADVQPRFSPHGHLLSFMRDNGTSDFDVYVVHANGGKLVQLTATPDRFEYWSSWSGDDVIFSAAGADGIHLYAVDSGGGVERRVSTVPQAPFSATFDTPLDSSLWHTISDPGGSVGVSRGALVASISGSAVPGGQWNQVDEHVGSQCSLNGDFDYQVDYALLTWPEFGGFYTQLSAFFANGGIARASSPFSPPYNQQYWANTNDSAGSFTTHDTSGTFRLVRTNGIMSAYVKSPTNPNWRLVTSGSAPGSTVYGMGLWASGDQFAHKDGAVAYDNFRLNSGVLTCPSWWNDFAPDVG
jgi:Tol biopolymer transport system component